MTSFGRGVLVLAALWAPLRASGTTAVDWTSGTGGTADGVVVTTSGLFDPVVATSDLSGSPFEGARLSASAEVLGYGSGSDWTVTLSEPVDALLVYANGWRGTDAGVDPATYHFDAPFTVLSGLLNADFTGSSAISRSTASASTTASCSSAVPSRA
jgi:hypothetical protein